MRIYRIYKEEINYISSDVYDEDGYADDSYDDYEVTETTIKYVDSFEKLKRFIDNCGIGEDLAYEEIEVE